MKTVAIVPAAGSGKRFAARQKKPFALLKGKPLIAHTLKALNSSRDIDEIVVAVEAPFIKRLEMIVSKYGIRKITSIVKGAATRLGSVKNCFDAIDPDCDMVLVHDGARPFPAKQLIRDSIRIAKRFGGCISAIPMTDTVKLADGKLFIKKTLDRRHLWRAQTPQVFRYSFLKDALRNVHSASRITDDASILESVCAKVKIIKGSERNIKITTLEDLKMAEALL